MNSLFELALAIAAIVLAAATTSAVSAADYFLTIGGGYGVTGNQLSLERNVVFQQALARPEQRAILQQLPSKLGLDENSKVEDVEQKLGQVESKVSVANAKLGTAMSTQSTTRERVQEEVREIWPELHVDNSPLAMTLSSERADEFVSTVSAMPAFKALAAAKEHVKQFSEERLELAREEARLRRLLNTCQTVARAANLSRIAPEIVSRYEQLVALEEESLVAPSESAAVSQSASTAPENSHEE